MLQVCTKVENILLLSNIDLPKPLQKVRTGHQMTDLVPHNFDQKHFFKYKNSWVKVCSELKFESIYAGKN